MTTTRSNDIRRALGCVLSAAVLGLNAIPPARAEEPRPVPACQLKGMDNNESFDLQRYRGKVLYVDFWASWCGPCVKSFPFLNLLDRDYRERGLEVLGINLDENIEDASVFLARHPAEFPIAVDPDKNCPRGFGVQGMPTSYLIDRQGTIRLVHLGFRPDDARQLRAHIEQLLNEQPAQPQGMQADQ